MQCINYAKREQEKPLLFKLTLRSHVREPPLPPDGMDPRNTLN